VSRLSICKNITIPIRLQSATCARERWKRAALRARQATAAWHGRLPAQASSNGTIMLSRRSVNPTDTIRRPRRSRVQQHRHGQLTPPLTPAYAVGRIVRRARPGVLSGSSPLRVSIPIHCNAMSSARSVQCAKGLRIKSTQPCRRWRSTVELPGYRDTA